MGKYYVLSGCLQMVIAAPHIKNYKDAAIESCLIYLKEKDASNLAPILIVSELGFELDTHEIDEDYVFGTVDILKKAGLIQ